MSLNLRRLLNYLPLPHGSSSEIYIRATWHKPTPFDQWKSQPPWRPSPALRTNHFSRGLRRQRLTRLAIRWGLGLVGAWLVIESIRGLALL